MRREAIVDCVEAGRESYRNMWARTSVDLLVRLARQHTVTLYYQPTAYTLERLFILHPSW